MRRAWVLFGAAFGVALTACSLFAGFEGFTPDGAAARDAGTRAADGPLATDALSPVDVGLDAGMNAGDGSSLSPRCGEPVVFCEDFERVDFEGIGAPPWGGMRRQGGGAIAIVTPAGPPPGGLKAGEFSVTARDGGPPTPDGGVFEFSAANGSIDSTLASTRYIYASELLWLEKRPVADEVAEIFTLESRDRDIANSRILVQIYAGQTLFMQHFPNSTPKLNPVVVSTGAWPIQVWTQLEVLVDLVGRTAVLKRNRSEVAQLALSKTVAGASTLLAGISFYGTNVHGPFQLRLDNLLFRMSP